jgi:hypothetical protein
MATFVIDEVEFNLNILRVLMLNWIGLQVDDTDIVTIDKCVVGTEGNAIP